MTDLSIGPTYYVRHPDDSYSVADPQPVTTLAALHETIARQQRAIERKNWALRMLKDRFPSDFDNMWKDALDYTGESP